MGQHALMVLADSSPHNTALHGFAILWRIVGVILILVCCVIALFLVFFGLMGIVQLFKQHPGPAIAGFLVLGGLVTWISAIFVSSWAIALLIGAGAGAVCLAIMGLSLDS
jgi:hypothetical protein